MREDITFDKVKGNKIPSLSVLEKIGTFENNNAGYLYSLIKLYNLNPYVRDFLLHETSYKRLLQKGETND